MKTRKIMEQIQSLRRMVSERLTWQGTNVHGYWWAHDAEAQGEDPGPEVTDKDLLSDPSKAWETYAGEGDSFKSSDVSGFTKFLREHGYASATIREVIKLMRR